MGDRDYVTELAILEVVRNLHAVRPRVLTFGQIYMELIRAHSNVPSIKECVVIVDALVIEGLLVSNGLLNHDPAFPYAQHLIGGITEVGMAALNVHADL